MSGEDDLGRRIRGIGALTEPVRRALYRYVAEQPQPVGRDAVAAAVGIARHTAKFHLDRLVADGLLEARFQRLTGRTGPGAGRPAKLYSRAPGEVAVSLPERRYDVAGTVMAAAIESSARTGAPVLEALRDAAARHGEKLAAGRPAGRGPLGQAPTGEGPVGDVGTGSVTDRAQRLLADQGYEPSVVGDDIVLANCPFHALVADHPELVCRLNLALLGAVGESLAVLSPGEALTARLDPQPGRCCVVLSRTSRT